MTTASFPQRFTTCFLLSLFAVGSVGRWCHAQSLSPQESVRQMKVPDGFRVDLVAAEPLVRQPVAIEFDDRGRLWVIQYLQYPNPAGLKRIKVDRYSRTIYDRVPKPPPHGPRGADRITILEDHDQDGQMDTSKDFVAGLNLATGIAFGHGGVFVLNVPYLLFYPDHDRDDVPDDDPEVLLTGFGMEDAHSVANSLTWGPDGWLYGCQGSTVTANIRGIEFQQGVWRYHPMTKQFELFCEGGGNSWGLDFDATGNLFYSTNYGGYVLLHGVQGGYFVKSFAKHGALHNPHTYGYLNHAPHDDFRGGHVTVGGIVYQADQFPESFRGKYIAADLLGHAVRWHGIEPHGSTFKTVNGGELLTTSDPWFAPTDVALGPDGAIYVSDWHDARTAHPDPDAEWDRSNGRVVRISYGHRSTSSRGDLARTDFSRLDQQDLLAMCRHKNQWWVRRARAELAHRSRQQLDRSAHGRSDLTRKLVRQAVSADAETDALEVLWTLASVGEFDESIAIQLLESPHPAVRRWVVRLLGDQHDLSNRMAGRLHEIAEREPNAAVRRQLASTAKRLPEEQALPLVNAAISRDLDSDDPFLPLLWWWAVEHHSVSGRAEVMRWFGHPAVRKSRLARHALLPRLARRYAAEASPGSDSSLVRLLRAAPTSAERRPLWDAILAGWNQRTAGLTEPAVTESHELSRVVLESWLGDPHDLAITDLAIKFRHRAPIEAAEREAFDRSVAVKRRAALLGVLASAQQQSCITPALKLLDSGEPTVLRRAALILLSRFDSDRVTAGLMKRLESQEADDLRDEIRQFLLTRRSSAKVFLAAVEQGRVNADSVPLEEVRQIALVEDVELDASVVKHWGSLRAASPGEKLAEVRRLNNDLRAGAGNVTEGRKLFKQQCASCHTLFGKGTKLGPDLTSANRSDRQFLLVSLVDPDQVVRKEFMSLVIQTTDGRVFSGLPVGRDASGLRLTTTGTNRTITIANAEIEAVRESSVSFMPGDLYRQFSPQQLRDLFRYLQSESGN